MLARPYGRKHLLGEGNSQCRSLEVRQSFVHFASSHGKYGQDAGDGGGDLGGENNAHQLAFTIAIKIN